MSDFQAKIQAQKAKIQAQRARRAAKIQAKQAENPADSKMNGASTPLRPPLSERNPIVAPAPLQVESDTTKSSVTESHVAVASLPAGSNRLDQISSAAIRGSVAQASVTSTRPPDFVDTPRPGPKVPPRRKRGTGTGMPKTFETPTFSRTGETTGLSQTPSAYMDALFSDEEEEEATPDIPSDLAALRQDSPIHEAASPPVDPSTTATTSAMAEEPPAAPQLDILRRDSRKSFIRQNSTVSTKSNQSARSISSSRSSSSRGSVKRDAEEASIADGMTDPHDASSLTSRLSKRSRGSPEEPKASSSCAETESTIQMKIDGAPVSSTVSNRSSSDKVVLPRRDPNRSKQEDLEMLRNMRDSSARIAGEFSKSNNQAMVDAAKTATVESVRYDALESYDETGNRGARVSSASELELRDVEVSKIRILPRQITEGVEVYAFLMLSRGPEVEATELYRTQPYKEIEIPTVFNFPELEQDFTLKATIYVATLPSAPISNDDAESTPSRHSGRRLRSAVSRLGNKANRAVSKLRNRSSLSAHTLPLASLSETPVPAATLEFEPVATITIDKEALFRKRLSAMYDDVTVGMTGSFELSVDAFRRNTEEDITSESGYLCMFERNGSTAGRWRRYFTQMDRSSLRLWRSARDAEWGNPPARMFNLTEFDSDARCLSRAECARRYSMAVVYNGHELRVACDGESNAERWADVLAKSVARAKAWETKSDTK